MNWDQDLELQFKNQKNLEEEKIWEDLRKKHLKKEKK